MPPFRRLGAVLVAALAVCSPGCGKTDGPVRVTIEGLGDEFRKEKGPAAWEGKRVVVTGGRVERVRPDYVLVNGETTDRTMLVDLLCYHKGAEKNALAKALRGQEVTVTGRVVRHPGGANVLIKLEDCTFALGKPPRADGRAVLASKGRGEVEAERDIKAGKLKLRFRYGRRQIDPPPWFPAYERLLKDRCGVETDVKREAGPIAGLHPDDREYNAVMTAAVEKKFGRGIVARLQKEAEAGRPEKR